MNVTKDKYRTKHAPGTIPDPAIAAALKEGLVNNAISCAGLAELAGRLRKSMAQLGTVLDLLEGRIVECQLGLFGYHPQKKIIRPAAQYDPAIEAEIRSRLISECLPCDAAWEIAAAFALPRINIASICEQRGIKIKPCQLGAF